MKKIIVIGCPGSGKSTFSRALHDITGIALFHLDMMKWNADRTTVSREVLIERQRAAMARDEWIIDGNYGSTMEMRMKECDTVFFLDYPLEVCLGGIESRRGKARPDMPWGETEPDEEFLSFVRAYNTEKRPGVLRLLEQYADRNIIIFKSREESERYLRELAPA